FKGDEKGGPFDISGGLAAKMLSTPSNPNGRPNSDVVLPWMNGMDITRRWADHYIIDFGSTMTLEEASLYEAPFEYIREHVYPVRLKNRDPKYAEKWWVHRRPVEPLKAAVAGLGRYICTPRVAKYRLFVWLNEVVVPDSRLFI